MIGERVALLLGLFLVPALLLWLGHGFRAASPRRRRLFWGGVVGHLSGLALTTVMAVTPPIWWAGGSFWRDFAVHWSLLFGALIGAGLAAAVARARSR